MTRTAQILRSLDTITHETLSMLEALEDVPTLPDHERRGAKQKMLQIRGLAQELFNWASEVRLEEQRN